MASFLQGYFYRRELCVFGSHLFSLKASSSSSVKATIETGSSLVAEVHLLVSLPSVFFSFAIITLLPISRARKRKRLLRKSLEEVII